MSEDEESDDAAEQGAEETEPVDLEAIRERLDGLAADLEPLESSLEAAETEDDLDVVEADLESVRAELESVEVPEPPETDDDEDEEDAEPAPEEELQEQYDEIESDLSDLESDLEDQRGPYGEDVVSEIEGVGGTITGTRWTEEGNAELIEAVDDFLDELNGLLDSSVTLVNQGEDVAEQLDATLDDAADAVADAGLDADDDAETIAGLLEATDDLEGDVDDATEWTDLEIREQLRREGYYDVLDHVKDFPPEWHALKVHEKRGNVDQILLALETFDSDFMEEHCMESLERMGSRAEPAIDAMLQKANRRDQAAMRILGKIGVENEEIVETLVDYVDSNPNLQQPAFRALGEIGAEDAVEPIAQQLVADEADVRSWAARALGLIGDTRAIDPLADRLADDESDRVRASAAWALNRIGTQEALEIVADYDDDRAYLVQAEAENVDLEPAA